MNQTNQQQIINEDQQLLIDDIYEEYLLELPCNLKIEKEQINEPVQIKEEPKVQKYCDICDKFITAKNFYHHVKRKHINSSKFFTCDFDGKEFNLKNDLKSHMKTHTTRNLRAKVFCETCNSSFLSMSALRAHNNMFHSEYIEIHPCEVVDCDKIFPSRMKLLQHTITSHRNGTFHCLKCQKNFSSSSNLKKHLKTHEDAMEICHLCGKNILRSKIKNHLLTHTQPKFKCSFLNCEKAYHARKSLKDHSLTHTATSTETCLDCNAVFSNIKYLKRHQRRQHPETRIQCEVPNCLSTFNRKDHIIQHYTRKHADLHDKILKALIQKARRNNFVSW